MEEIEFKIKYNEREKEKVAAFCKENGYVFAGISRQSDTYLSPPHMDIISKDEAMRVRYESDPEKWTLTYKCRNRSKDGHQREELETSIGDGTVLLDILDRLNFVFILKIEKKRETYKGEKYTVCFDDVKGLGTFIEIEYMTHDNDEETEKIKEEMVKLVDEWRLDDRYFVEKNYLSLLMEEME